MVLLLLLVLFGDIALAQKSQQWLWCQGKDGATTDEQISGCTAVIRSGRESRQNLAIAFNNRGIALTRQREYDRAFEDFSQAIRLSPQFSSAFVGRGVVHRHKGKNDRALHDFDEAVRLDPRNDEAFYFRSQTYLTRRDTARAIDDLNEVIRLTPGHARALEARCAAYVEKHEYDRALDDCNAAIKLNSKALDALVSRGIIYRNKGEHDRAIRDYDDALRMSPNDARAFANRCSTYADKGVYDRAIADCDQAIQIDPGLSVAFNSRGVAFQRKGDFDRAIKDYDQAIRTSPNYALAFANRCGAYLSKREYVRAIQDCDRAVQIDPRNALALWHRGRAKLGIGDQTGGAGDIRAAKAISPNIEAGTTIAGSRSHQDRTEPSSWLSTAVRKLITVAILLGLVVPATIALARAKGRSAAAWAFASLVFNIFALAVLWFLPAVRREAAGAAEAGQHEASAARSPTGEGTGQNEDASRSATAASEVPKADWVVNSEGEIRSAEAQAGAANGSDRMSKKLMAEGNVEGRVYRVFADGHVEYESLLGLRIFESEEEFRDYVGEGKAGQKRRRNSWASNQMAIGFFVCLVGTLITFATYTAATSAGGGRYVIAWGAILFGAIQFLIGLSSLYSPEAPTETRNDRAPKPAKEEAAHTRIVASGTVSGRPYRIFTDGHVEYESLIGLRIFESEKEFRDWVR